MNTTQVRQLIKEAITDRLKMIDEAGDKAAINAKIAKIEEDIKEAHEIMNAIPANASHYAAPEIVSDLKDDLQNSIDELENKKQELNDQLAELNKPVKEAKKKPSAGMTKKAKSAVVKKAKAGKDIGKPGKGFEKVAQAAGGGEAGQKIAAAAMWKGQAK